MKKKLLIILVISLLAVLMVLSGCRSSNEGTAVGTSVNAIDNSYLKTENNIDPIEEPEPAIQLDEKLINPFNCITIEGNPDTLGVSGFIIPDELPDDIVTSVIAVINAVSVLDYWKINGIPVEGNERILIIDVTESIVIEAVSREDIVVTSINAYMQIIDENGNSTGDIFYNKIFENNIANLSSNPISINVHAEVPEGYIVDYWLINNVPLQLTNSSGFAAVGLTESTVFEAVLRESMIYVTNIPTITPVTTATPATTTNPPTITLVTTATPEPTPETKPTPEPTPESTPEPTPVPETG